MTISELIETLELFQYEARSRDLGDIETNVSTLYWAEESVTLEVES